MTRCAGTSLAPPNSLVGKIPGNNPQKASCQGHDDLTCIRGPAEYGCASAFADSTVSGVALYQCAHNGH